MNVIHLASFGGNYGDVLNHQGFYNTVGNALGFDTVNQIEVRRFYKNASPKERLLFNDDFLKEINKHDLFVIGGGGFFDAKWAYSNTGTTIDFSDSFIDGISIPVVVNGMGYHEFYEETTPEVCKKFQIFIEKIIAKGWFLSFRNDGSIKRFRNRYGHTFDGSIKVVPDNGFFGVNVDSITPVKLPSAKKTIGLCLTNDLFTKAYNGALNTDIFNSEILGVLEKLSERYQIVLFAHTPDDVVRVGQYFEDLPNSIKRYNIVVCPYMPNGTDSINEMARYYSVCDVIVGMRFHSLIMGLQLGKPTIALANHSQIGDFYEELGLENYRILLNNEDFDGQFLKLIEKVQQNQKICLDIKNVLNIVKAHNQEYVNDILNFINQ